jgi:hypothetical protein
VPPKPRLFVSRPRNLDSSLKYVDEKYHQSIENAYVEDVGGMKASAGKNEFEWERRDECEKIRRGRVGKDGVTFDALNDQKCSVKSDLGALVGHDSIRSVY